MLSPLARGDFDLASGCACAVIVSLVPRIVPVHFPTDFQVLRIKTNANKLITNFKLIC